MKLTVIPRVTNALGSITKGLIKELEELEIGVQAETIQTTASLRLARIQNLNHLFQYNFSFVDAHFMKI